MIRRLRAWWKHLGWRPADDGRHPFDDNHLREGDE